MSLLLLAPAFVAFELWQLVVSERLVGLKQLDRNVDPRALGPGAITAFCWSGALMFYWVWMAWLLFLPMARLHAVGLLAISAVGYGLRRGCRLKWLLVVLTFEGAARIGLLLSLTAYLWRHW